MKNKLELGLLIIIAGIFLFSIMTLFNKPNNENLNSLARISESTVTVKIEPEKFADNNFYFKINLDTHSADLSKLNLRELIILEYEGKIVKPADTPKLQGHHNSGDLVFNLDKKPEKFTIKIKDIPDLPLRIFEWGK
ncbi:hypothetical protein HYX16_06615 [Candidatus Woesearchaeota archaeon]|nr:hypothetical protein [Candidatus Woesearchaeota archaeon]